MIQFIFGLIYIFSPITSVSQIPKKAVAIADSVCKTRLLCPDTRIELTDSICYPRKNIKYQKQAPESYFFVFHVYVKNDIVTDLNVHINKDLTINYVSGLPDSNFKFNACQIMPRYELWEIAKRNGLRTKFTKCRYYLGFEEDGIYILFLENKSKWKTDHYTLNALTGKFINHVKLNVDF